MTRSDPDGIRAHFRHQAGSCARMASSFTAQVCNLATDHLTDDTRSGSRVLNWIGDAGPDALALRFAGALHAVVLKGMDTDLAAIYPPNGPIRSGDALWQAIQCALHVHDDFIHDWMELPPQTNEVARAAMILPALQSLSARFDRPLALYEIGTSAGLTLQLTSFGYDYDGVLIGPTDAPVQLSPEVKSAPPLHTNMPTVISRRGCDLNPLDTRDAASAIRLRSYVWPDQPDRHDRVSGAMALYAADPPVIEQADAAEWVCGQLATRSEDAISVFFHTIVWQYLPEETKKTIEQALAGAGADATPQAPLAFLGMEGYGNSGYALLEQTMWSGNADTDGQKTELARVDYHGRWIDWHA